MARRAARDGREAIMRVVVGGLDVVWIEVAWCCEAWGHFLGTGDGRS